jgi:E3 ubiquitin-protein ligase HUWE1
MASAGKEEEEAKEVSEEDSMGEEGAQMDVVPESLDAVTRAAAESAGVDIEFLLALPPELRHEVLAQHGVQLPSPAPTNAAAAVALQAVLANDHVAAVGREAATAGQQEEEADDDMEVDPEFLAALPPEIQAEVLAEQQAERRRRQREREREEQRRRDAAVLPAGEAEQAGAAAAAAGEGDMDIASLLSSFPPDLREEILLTGDEVRDTKPYAAPQTSSKTFR